jgi:hypothetical protein
MAERAAQRAQHNEHLHPFQRRPNPSLQQPHLSQRNAGEFFRLCSTAKVHNAVFWRGWRSGSRTLSPSGLWAEADCPGLALCEECALRLFRRCVGLGTHSSASSSSCVGSSDPTPAMPGLELQPVKLWLYKTAPRQECGDHDAFLASVWIVKQRACVRQRSRCIVCDSSESEHAKHRFTIPLGRLSSMCAWYQPAQKCPCCPYFSSGPSAHIDFVCVFPPAACMGFHGLQGSAT